MKNVILIGDSIRMGYQETVTKELADVAEVWGPEENGGHTINVLGYLHYWVFPRPADVIHINCGLHDLKTIVYGETENLIPLHQYRENIRRMLQKLRAQTSATLIWATTTPINEQVANETHLQWKDFSRYEADVLRYNQAALEVTGELGVPVDDLYSIVMTAEPATILRQNDGVHFTGEGCDLLGKTVADCIRKYL
ncbi:MAG: GDSL-type esterase/lipase family protein [bacterium]